MKKIYIVLTYTGTWLSKVVRFYTRKDYSHVSISLDENLNNMYSFGRINPYNPFSCGFVKESPRHGTFKRFNKVNLGVLNKPPLTLDNELFKLDKNFLREISPINNFIIVNKKKNDYLKKKKRELMDIKDSFYFDINILK